MPRGRTDMIGQIQVPINNHAEHGGRGSESGPTFAYNSGLNSGTAVATEHGSCIMFDYLITVNHDRISNIHVESDGVLI